MLLAFGRYIELSAHFAAQISQVLAQGVEAGDSGPTKVAKLVVEFGDVAVGRAGEDTGSCGVLLTRLYPLRKPTHLGFQRLHAGFEVVRLHAPEPTAVPALSNA